jgi:L-rhamnonate dehydratase
MRITEVEVIELRVPGWDASGFDGSWDTCVVRIHTDAGVTGLSETDSLPSVIRAIVDARSSHTGARGLGEVLVGQDPTDIEGLWQRMYDATSYIGRRGVMIHAISAVDIALWDLRGKLENRPVAELLGTVQRDRLLAYGTVYPLG